MRYEILRDNKAKNLKENGKLDSLREPWSWFCHTTLVISECLKL